MRLFFHYMCGCCPNSNCQAAFLSISRMTKNFSVGSVYVAYRDGTRTPSFTPAALYPDGWVYNPTRCLANLREGWVTSVMQYDNFAAIIRFSRHRDYWPITRPLIPQISPRQARSRCQRLPPFTPCSGRVAVMNRYHLGYYAIYCEQQSCSPKFDLSRHADADQRRNPTATPVGGFRAWPGRRLDGQSWPKAFPTPCRFECRASIYQAPDP